MKLAVEVPDVERSTVQLLDSLTTHTVGVNLPDAWSAGSATFVQVQWDGTPSAVWPVLVRATVRVTVFAGSPTVAKGVAARCQGLLLAEDAYTFLTGILPARDPDTRAPIASFTVRCTARTAPIT